MKITKQFLLAGFSAAVLVGLVACDSSDMPAESMDMDKGSTEKETALDHAGKHLDPKYVCPMHPTIVQDAPGNCPLCGMNAEDTATKTNRKKRRSFTG